MHEPPTVPNAALAALDASVTEGLVITIEPIISAGTGAIRPAGYRWTVRSGDRALSAHPEETLVITGAVPVFVTA
jgi:methionyl aminopeptidase